MHELIQNNKSYRIDLHRALELLSDYHMKLVEPEEKFLNLEIERLICVLKSRFFQALIDIQEYYEVTLIDESKLDNFLEIKKRSINYQNVRNDIFCNLNSYIDNTNNIDEKRHVNDDIRDEISLLRGESGLGFSIVGGFDNPHRINDCRIFVTKIIPGGAAATNGKLQVFDVIEKVNNISVTRVSHAAAVEILKQAGDQVKLLISRKQKENIVKEIHLTKEKEGYGFSIAGGTDNQHFPGDNGIFITKILIGGVAQKEGNLEIGSQLIAIENSLGIQNLENVPHAKAVNALKNSKEKIILYTVQPSMKNIESNKYFKDDIQEKHFFDEKKNADQSFSKKSEQNDGKNIALTDIEKMYRTVTLLKGPNGLGFNIIGGENEEGIFISYILNGGPSDLDGNLMVGDLIKSVNGMDFTNITHEKAATILKGCNNLVTLEVENKYDDFRELEYKYKLSQDLKRELFTINERSSLKTTKKKSMHVRALFNYEPSDDDDLPSVGLAFHFGDILHVKNACDGEWWLATKVEKKNIEICGVIPSPKRWERKQKAKDRSVKFERQTSNELREHLSMLKKKKNYSFSRKFPFMKNKDDKLEYSSEEKPSMLCYTQSGIQTKECSSEEILYRVELPNIEELTMVYLEHDEDEENLQLCSEENTLCYEEVKMIEIDYARPIVIIGPIKDQINDDLISQFPEKFESCVPHTTRLKKDHEIDGKDYYFIPSREIMENDIRNQLFIEAGQYNENLYGTSIASVKEIAEKGKHCILDVSVNAIKRLYSAQLYPISLFIRVRSPEFLLSMNNQMSIDHAKKFFFHFRKIEQDFAEYFTDIIEGDNYEEIYEEIKKKIRIQSHKYIWISSELKYDKI